MFQEFLPRPSRLDRPSFSGDQRGQSYLIGTVLVIGMSVAATTAMLIAGVGFLNTSQAQAETESAQQSFQQMGGEIALVAGAEEKRGVIDLGLQNPSKLTTTDKGVFRVQALNTSDGSVEETLLEKRLGTVEYEVDAPGGNTRTVVYQSGGVWVQSNNDPTATAARTLPKMQYNQQTLTLPLISINESASATTTDGDVVVSQSSPTTAVYPNESAGRVNPVEDRRIQLSYEGEYYMAWKTVFEHRFDGDVTVDHDTRTTSVVLVTPDLVQQVNSGLRAGGSSSDAIFIRGSGGAPSFVDSYNSSEGAYSVSSSSNGSVRANGDITLRGDASIRGDAVVPDGYLVDVGGGSEVTGEIRHEDVVAPSLTTAVYDKCAALESSNDNDASSEISGNELTGLDDGSASLSSGDYYLDQDLVVGSGETLTIDNSGGPVNVCVTGDVEVSGGDISVTNESDGGRVNVYQKGDSFEVTNSGSVSVPNEHAPSLWFYGGNDVTVLVKDSRVVGVVSMPAGTTGSGEARIQTGGEVFGAVISGPIEMRSGGKVHYDQSLVDEEAMGSLESVTVVSYLHINVYDVQLED